MNVKYILGLIVFVIVSVNVNAQTYIQYTYDLNGNRQTRQVLVMQLKSAAISFPITDLGVLEEEEEELSDINEEPGIRVYPNPARECIVVEFSGSLTDNHTEARLYDLNGNLIEEKRSKDQLLEVDITALIDGIYILIINKDGNTSIHKIIKSQGR